MYDQQHLLKNVRNNLKSSDFLIGEDHIKWTYIEDFYNRDSKLPIRMAPKLTQKHIVLPPFTKMRVSLAAQTLSHSVAAGISTLSALEHMEMDAINTANYWERFDCLFSVF